MIVNVLISDLRTGFPLADNTHFPEADEAEKDAKSIGCPPLTAKLLLMLPAVTVPAKLLVPAAPATVPVVKLLLTLPVVMPPASPPVPAAPTTLPVV